MGNQKKQQALPIEWQKEGCPSGIKKREVSNNSAAEKGCRARTTVATNQ